MALDCMICGKRLEHTHHGTRQTCSRACALQLEYALKLVAHAKGDRSGVVPPPGTRTQWDQAR